MGATRPVSGGWSTAERVVVELEDGRSVFAKCAHQEPVIGFLRTEHAFYQAVRADFMPELIAFLENDPPVLVLEDLSSADWPPPWPVHGVGALRTTLDRLHATPPPSHVPRLADEREGLTDCWATIAAGPGPFLSLGVCSREWLERALPVLDEASQAAPIDGRELLHLDVRSDNVCFLGERTVLVDWNWACIGNGLLDVAAWAPSLHLEGGPRPDELIPSCPPGFAAMLAGFFGSRAALPPPPTAPFVREIQLAQLRVALPWAAVLLDLPRPGLAPGPS